MLRDKFKSFGMFPDMGKLTDMFNQKFDALISKLDEILAELKKQNAGQFGVILVCGMVVLVLALIGLFAVCTPGEDDHSLGRIQVAYHERGRCYDEYDCDDGYGEGDGYSQRYDQNYGSRDDRNRNRNRDRGAFSPGPFRDSPVTICLPNSCNSDGRGRGDEPPPEEERS